MRARVIPCLLLRDHGLVKTTKFKNPVYIGDPLNTVRIFSEKEVDELVILDIDATIQGREPDYELIAQIAGECFMPIAYGGGVKTLEQARKLIRCGVEKIVVNSATLESPRLISQIGGVFGSQAVVGSIDVRRTLFGGYRVSSRSGTVQTMLRPDDHASTLVECGVGEILLTSIDHDGGMQGYDLKLIRQVVDRVSVPVVACGGAGAVAHFQDALNHAGASAVAGGSFFIFHGKHRAVLISYPSALDL